MRSPPERSRPPRVAAIVFVVGVALALAGAATAETDIGLRRDTLWSEPQPALRLLERPAASAVRHRRARRIWAASRSRPLKITLARRGRLGSATARRRTDVPVRAAILPAAEPQVVFPKLTGRPVSPRPALVTIYQDRTLRNGDAVMMADGVHVFRGAGQWPHQPRDFVRLTFAAALDWHLRQTLDAFDKNPPTRWTWLGSAAG